MKYRTIVADPPWNYDAFANNPKPGNRGEKECPYPTMELDDIGALPVREQCEADCRLFLWTTNRYLRDAFDVMARWGFRYTQTIVWHKTGNPSPFGGSVGPIHCEFLLVGRHGSPPLLQRWPSSVVSANVGDHSAKPEVFLDLIEQSSPAPRLEMFARRQRLGWDTWGNECRCDVEMEVST